MTFHSFFFGLIQEKCQEAHDSEIWSSHYIGGDVGKFVCDVCWRSKYEHHDHAHLDIYRSAERLCQAMQKVANPLRGLYDVMNLRSAPEVSDDAKQILQDRATEDRIFGTYVTEFQDIMKQFA